MDSVQVHADDGVSKRRWNRFMRAWLKEFRKRSHVVPSVSGSGSGSGSSVSNSGSESPSSFAGYHLPSSTMMTSKADVSRVVHRCMDSFLGDHERSYELKQLLYPWVEELVKEGYPINEEAYPRMEECLSAASDFFRDSDHGIFQSEPADVHRILERLLDKPELFARLLKSVHTDHQLAFVDVLTDKVRGLKLSLAAKLKHKKSYFMQHWDASLVYHSKHHAPFGRSL